MIEQPGDRLNHGFSYWLPWDPRASLSCWLTYTNEKTHAIIRDNLHLAPMYCGSITGIGTRYCPAIENKVVNFPQRERHRVFIEPEGLNTDEMYIAGLSSSLPEEIQDQFIRTVPGLEAVEIVRPGYAIEYDVVAPEQLQNSLQIRGWPGVFSAGQINGTSGYEEAAAQGIIAGINAGLYLKGEEPFTLARNEAYIGVLIDDLVTKENNEPYRIMTSRAEFRLSLRQDNADLRLTGVWLSVTADHARRIRPFSNETATDRGKARIFFRDIPYAWVGASTTPQRINRNRSEAEEQPKTATADAANSDY